MFKVFEPSRDEDEGREEERKQRQDIKDYEHTYASLCLRARLKNIPRAFKSTMT